MALTATKKTDYKGSPHRFVDLEVNEVSLVTTPAILLEGEGGEVGLPVVKISDTPAVPASVLKSLSVSDDEDVLEALTKLSHAAAECVYKAFPLEVSAYYAQTMKIVGDTVILGEPWGDPFRSEFTAYSVKFSRSAEGEFLCTDASKLKIMFVAASGETVTKVCESPDSPKTETEKQMQFYTVKLKDTEMSWPAVPGAVVKSADGTVICACTEKGELSLGEQYFLEGFQISPKPAQVSAPVVEAVADTEKACAAEEDKKDKKGKPDFAQKYFSMEDLQKIAATPGKSVKMVFSADGGMTLDVTELAVAQKEEPKAEVQKEEPKVVETQKLEAENRTLLQELGTRVAKEGETYAAPAKKSGGSLGNQANGLFTQHLVHNTPSVLTR